MPSTYLYILATILLSLNFVRPMGLAISDWLYFGALVLAAVETLFLERRNLACWVGNRFFLPAVGIGIGAILSTMMATNVTASLVEITQQIYAITIFVSLTWIMVRRGQTELVVRAFIFSGVFSALIAVIDYATGSRLGPMLSGRPDVQLWYRYAGTLGHPNKFGYFIAISSILTFRQWAALAWRQIFFKILMTALLGLQLFAIYLSGSVTAYLGLLVGVTAMVIFSRQMNKQFFRVATPIMLIAILMGIIFTVSGLKLSALVQISESNILTRSISRVQSETATERLTVYEEAVTAILKSPIIGAGYDQISTSGIEAEARYLDTSVHNALLQIWYTGGLFAFLGWFAIYASLGWWAIKLLLANGRNKKLDAIIGIAACTLSILLMDQFQDGIYQREKWVLLGLLAGHAFYPVVRKPTQQIIVSEAGA